jgi:flagellar hook-associated protein 3 FlgL
MRVTQGMLNQQLLADLEANTSRISQIQQQLATGKRINSPSDDPVGAVFTMRYKADIAYYQQYQQNATAAQGWLNYTNIAMNQAVQVMQRARDLAVQGASDTVTATDRQAIAAEVDQLYQQLVTIGNSQYSGHYVFGGQAVMTPPYPASGAENVSVDTGSIVYHVGDNVQLQVNVTGAQFFGQAVPQESDNAFALLSQLSAALKANDGNEVRQLIGQIDSRLDKMTAAQADVGARLNRVQFEQNRLSDLVNNFQTLLAGVDDTDMAKAIVDLNTAQSVQQASLQVGARVLIPTLADFLK